MGKDKKSDATKVEKQQADDFQIPTTLKETTLDTSDWPLLLKVLFAAE
jgi:hypothetical protein